MEDGNKFRKQPDAFNPAEALKLSLLDPSSQVDAPPTILTINGKSCMKARSLSVLIGKAKARKGFFINAIVTAAASGRCSVDGIEGKFNNGKSGVIVFDTEQGAYWAQLAHKRIIKAIGTERPPNLQYYDLQQYTPAQRLEMVNAAITEHENLSMVVIDGIRDLISSINDEVQATEMCSNILRWCATKEIHVVTVLHQNKNDQNARGHIGTELINKAETVISIAKEKDETISTVKLEFSRDRDFQPFSFCIDDEGLPRLSDYEQPATTKKKEDDISRFQYVFKDHPRLNNALVVKKYMEASGWIESTANKHIATALVSGIIVKDEQGNYSLPKTESENETLSF